VSEGRGIIFVRHAMPGVTRGLSSKLWGLSEAAKEDCVLLAHALPEQLAPAVYTSSEVKAKETATVIALRRGLEVVVDEGFGEVDRPEIWDEDYRGVVKRYLSGSEEPGWEPRGSVETRFNDAVKRSLRGAPQGEAVVVSHGIALSLYIASVAGIGVVRFWEALTFPDAWRVDLREGRIERIFSGGLGPE
jgi:broad specificity phosphatase PhoE